MSALAPNIFKARMAFLRIAARGLMTVVRSPISLFRFEDQVALCQNGSCDENGQEFVRSAALMFFFMPIEHPF